jgi:hypothetical protein
MQMGNNDDATDATIVPTRGVFTMETTPELSEYKD